LIFEICSSISVTNTRAASLPPPKSQTFLLCSALSCRTSSSGRERQIPDDMVEFEFSIDVNSGICFR